MLGRWPLRRWFRVLWCLLTLALIGCLPLIIIDFRRTGYSVHDQVTDRRVSTEVAWYAACHHAPEVQ